MTRQTAQGNGTALDAGFCQGRGSSRIGKFARIVVLTQVTKENIAVLTDLGVDFVSSGALTHSAPIMDISLKNLHPVE